MKDLVKQAAIAAGLLFLLLLVPLVPAFGLPRSGFSGETPGRNPTSDTSPRSPGATANESGKEQSPSSKLKTVPFGGRILATRICNTGELITVGPPRPGEYMIINGATKVFLYYEFLAGNWVLGLAAAGAVPCVLGTISVGAGLPVLIVGTSGIPAF